MTVMVKHVRHQTTLDIKVEHAFVTMVGQAITRATTSITHKFPINIKFAWGGHVGGERRDVDEVGMTFFCVIQHKICAERICIQHNYKSEWK